MADAQSLTRAQARAVDHIAMSEFGVPGIVLMENAGLLATLALVPLVTGPVAVLCGGGNNGGDGYVVARQLALRGYDVGVYSTGDPARITGDAALNRAIVEHMGLPLTPIMSGEQLAGAQREWASTALFVDALLGTGFDGEVRPHLARVIEALESARLANGALVVALDLPSGLDADAGTPSNATVRADRTLTFAARKVGFDVPGAERWTGTVEVLSIGAPPAALERARARA